MAHDAKHCRACEDTLATEEWKKQVVTFFNLASDRYWQQGSYVAGKAYLQQQMQQQQEQQQEQPMEKKQEQQPLVEKKLEQPPVEKKQEEENNLTGGWRQQRQRRQWPATSG